jgi:hypothetical protein
VKPMMASGPSRRTHSWVLAYLQLGSIFMVLVLSKAGF